MSIKNIAKEDMPRERMRKYGASVLSDSELLAIIIRTGSKKEDVLTLSKNLLSKSNIRKLSRASIAILEKNLGIGEAKACQICACFELGRRLTMFKEKKFQIKNAKDVARLLKTEMSSLTKEHLYVILLDTKRRVIRVNNLFIGSLDESIVHPREIFQLALEENAAGVILVHNHPSGDPTPSSADIESTNNIVKAGNMMGITVLDHIIIGNGNYISLRERNLIEDN